MRGGFHPYQLNLKRAAQYIGVTSPVFRQALLKKHKKLAAKDGVLPPHTMKWMFKALSLIVVMKVSLDLEEVGRGWWSMVDGHHDYWSEVGTCREVRLGRA